MLDSDRNIWVCVVSPEFVDSMVDEPRMRIEQTDKAFVDDDGQARIPVHFSLRDLPPQRIRVINETDSSLYIEVNDGRGTSEIMGLEEESGLPTVSNDETKTANRFGPIERVIVREGDE